MRRSSAGWALVSLSLVLCPLAGCLGSRCSSGQVLREGLCVPVLDGRTEGGTGELGATDAAAGERAADRGPDARATGAGCEHHAECQGRFCLVMPGQEVGYCTIRDCTLAPDSCPSGYMCIDAGLYSPGEPKICVKTS